MILFVVCVIIKTHKNAGVLELADEVDSKSTTPFHATVPESLDLSRVFDNSICNLLFMSLHDVPPISRIGHRERDFENINAGVLELADEVDSKSTTPFHATVPETLDLQGPLTTQYVTCFSCPSTMSLRFLGRDIGSRTLKIEMPVCWNWQTRWTQNPLPAMACGFKSRHRHQTLTGSKMLDFQAFSGLSLFLPRAS